MIKALIQQEHKNSDKLVLQALIPFVDLKDKVLFTCKANPQSYLADYSLVTKENYKYYQRRINLNRVTKIESYVRQCVLSEHRGYSITALFPSALILAINEDDGNKIENKTKDDCLIALNNNVFIVDGQHRMMAMKSLYNKLKESLLRTPEDDLILDFIENYKFNCVVLVNYDLWEQGQVFVNVNFNQKPVNKSLYYEVFGSNYNEDPLMWKQNHIYLAHNLTKILNDKEESPYYHRIKMIGTGRGYVSQAFVVESLMRLFSLDGIWSIYKEKKGPNDNVKFMAVELLSFFVAVKSVFRRYWPDNYIENGAIICKTTGTGAFIRLMGDIHRVASDDVLLSLNTNEIKVSVAYYDHVCDLLSRVGDNKAKELFGQDSKYAGASGKGSEVKMYKELRSAIFNTNMIEDDQKNDFPINEIAEQLQEYLWLNVDSELDCLGYSYEYNELSDLVVQNCNIVEDSLSCKARFISGVTIYVDNEDQTGFNMRFPSSAVIRMNKIGEKWKLDQSSVKVSFDTSKYYE